MCRICELTKTAQEELLWAARLGEKMALTRLNFTDAANDDDEERMTQEREKLHSIVDGLLDSIWSVARVNKDLKDVLLQGPDEAFRGHGRGRPH